MSRPDIDPEASTALIGIDVGGTFTDFVYLAEGELVVRKLPTTCADQSEAIGAGLDLLSVAANAIVIHGTTVATNALLERRGASTALITTVGFADVLAIGRQNRPHLYRLGQHRPPPLVPKKRRFEVTERMDAQGHVLTELDEQEVEKLVDRLSTEGIESAAIVLLFSFRNPAHERRVAEMLGTRLPKLTLSLSSEILPEHREYERTVTTVVNAYVQPVIGRYLDRLENVLAHRRLYVMQSNGGTLGRAQAAQQAARLVLSGPAGGVMGAFALAGQALATEAPQVVTFDMGGTSTDVALCPGQVPHTAEGEIAGLPLRLPATEIHTVGAGGGSIARVDAGGVLRVGPLSAGAEPGPVCYGRGGTEPTVTDANLVLGRLRADRFLGGDFRLDVDAAHDALAALGELVGLSAEAVALGVLRVANATMERALRRVSVERGHDPRAYVLVPFGGAGPLHAAALATSLGIRRILLPPHPGVLSAFGLLMADVVYDTSQSVLHLTDSLLSGRAPLAEAVEELSEKVRAVLEGGGNTKVMLEALLEMRYAGQSYELEVPLELPITPGNLRQSIVSFHTTHEQRYGHADRAAPVEVVTLRVRGRVPGARPALPKEPRADTGADVALVDERPVWFDADDPTPTRCYARDDLRHGHHLNGPAVVYQYDTTIVIPPRWHARVDAMRNLWMERVS